MKAQVIEFPVSRIVTRTDRYVPDVDKSDVVEFHYEKTKLQAFRNQVKFFRGLLRDDIRDVYREMK